MRVNTDKSGFMPLSDAAPSRWVQWRPVGSFLDSVQRQCRSSVAAPRDADSASHGTVLPTTKGYLWHSNSRCLPRRGTASRWTQACIRAASSRWRGGMQNGTDCGRVRLRQYVQCPGCSNNTKFFKSGGCNSVLPRVDVRAALGVDSGASSISLHREANSNERSCRAHKKDKQSSRCMVWPLVAALPPERLASFFVSHRAHQATACTSTEPPHHFVALP